MLRLFSNRSPRVKRVFGTLVSLLLALALAAPALIGLTSQPELAGGYSESVHTLKQTGSAGAQLESGRSVLLDPVEARILRQVLHGSSGVQVKLRSLPALLAIYSNEEQAASRVATQARARLNYAQRIQRVQTGGLSDLTTTLPPPRPRA